MIVAGRTILPPPVLGELIQFEISDQTVAIEIGEIGNAVVYRYNAIDSSSVGADSYDTRQFRIGQISIVALSKGRYVRAMAF